MDLSFAKTIPGAKPVYLGLVRLHSWLFTGSMVAAYLRHHRVRKLHIGCGVNRLSGWLNSDLIPVRFGAIRLDATKRFPLPDASLDYVYSEHMIEHVPYAGGMAMLAEIFRVLKPGGRVRLSTPKLEFLLALMTEPKSDLQKAYIAWSCERFVNAGTASDAMVVNNFMRDFGHQFIYDRKTLVAALERTGFEAVESFDVGVSNDPELAGLETETRMPPGFLQLETFTLEARKPG
ncbi:methyltransferase domain-containing protein [Rhizomicrobium electricum]|jgi:predicted SAM-dependent methyltransferase|uniref:Methyltransferase type 11 domain-containing protein n=1 Tax=Rhizomicrobium electricum TaxID=480070 RepID=A0ABP3Q2J4_9PROT|nr:methyltransferase domain-containing protein [Rhizomicrobium electricum]NIJ49320.1 putative SAM-dependent methyltransferase [Rhizomicrobium electricum]